MFGERRSIQEIKWILNNPFSAARASRIGDAVTAEVGRLALAGRLGNDRPEGAASPGTPGDAVRHAMLSCELTQAFGVSTAAEITNNHEAVPENEQTNEQANMDRHNNTVGRRLAYDSNQSGSCSERAQNALSAGDLQTLTPAP